MIKVIVIKGIATIAGLPKAAAIQKYFKGDPKAPLFSFLCKGEACPHEDKDQAER